MIPPQSVTVEPPIMIRYRRLGRTNLQVSEIVFGGGFVGGMLVLADDDTRRRAIRRALDAGINWIDTAPLYAQGRSETALGWLLAEIEDRPYVSTKVELDVARLDDIAGQVERSVHESLQRLNRDAVDLLQLHNRIGDAAGNASQRAIGAHDILRDGGVADALERVREQGLTRFVGLTALGEAPAIVQVIDSARFDTAQVYYNMLNPSAARAMPPAWSGHGFSGVIDACTRHDVGVMGIRAFASGVLATDERHGREAVLTLDSDLDTEQRRAHAALKAVGDRYGTRAQTALRFALANRDLSCIIVGMAEPEHLEQAIAAAAEGELPPDAVARLEPVYEAGFEL
jgi:L-galactose dehydrogenase/L-glyceraldehyde 3-phosphate reductase